MDGLGTAFFRLDWLRLEVTIESQDLREGAR